MPASKRIIVTVPETLLFEMDSVTVSECKNRSEIETAKRFVLPGIATAPLREQMKKVTWKWQRYPVSLRVKI